ncbi:DivIVA domain-containing protein [Micromonospora sp. DT233]|uniref:DivIVA domain-containing protein n=1 Tax=Micromonospora sp. DT233 TaxID=3393432 RepID=UPI003CE99FF6
MAVRVLHTASRLTPLHPEQVRRLRFRHAALGRRGLAEEHVYAFLRRVVDELTARNAVEAGLREENTRLRNALRDWPGESAPTHGHTADSAGTGSQQRR